MSMRGFPWNISPLPISYAIACFLGSIGLAILMVACKQVPTSPKPTPPIAKTSTPNPLPLIDLATPSHTHTVTPLALSSTPTLPAAIGFPDPSNYHWRLILAGLTQPVDIQNAGDGSARLFIVEKGGRIRVVQGGDLTGDPFLDISARVGSQRSEQGLLGLAFHPHFAENGLFFVNYTDRNGNTVIARFQVFPGDPNRADPAFEKVLLRVDQPYANHNGGGLAFGPDGYLYIGLGDGGSGGDPHSNGQSLNTLLGKLLRIDVDQGERYAIPLDNPFTKGGGLSEIWAYGLRNPWRFTFDRMTGDLYIGDVGQNKWEEIDFLAAGTSGGVNFGWNYIEGLHAFQDQPPANLTLTPPVLEYGHDQGCSVTGGVVYRGAAFPEWQGIYLFGDFCSGKVWGLLNNGHGWLVKRLFETGVPIVSFGQDEVGEVYLVDLNGSILRLEQH